MAERLIFNAILVKYQSEMLSLSSFSILQENFISSFDKYLTGSIYNIKEEVGDTLSPKNKNPQTKVWGIGKNFASSIP